MEHPRMLRQLTRQYRFNCDINELASKLTYENKMTAHERGINQKKLVSEVGDWCTKTKVPDWLRDTIDPNKSITWVDTSSAQNLETKMESGYTNQVEIRLINEIITGLSDNVQLNTKHIGVIAPYRAQIKALKTKLLNITVDTVDKFQGKTSFCVALEINAS